MRRVMTRVLPLPAPARMRSGPSVCITASRWAGVRSASKSCSAAGIRRPPFPGQFNSPVRILQPGRSFAKISRSRFKKGTGLLEFKSPVPFLKRRLAGRSDLMEIVGIGTDIVECLRIGRMIEQHGEVFLTRVYTEREIRFCQARRRATEHFAARWAAKEAILRALGTPWRRGIEWTDIEIEQDA